MTSNKKQTTRYITSQTTTELINGKEVYRRIPAPVIPVFPILSWAGLCSFFSNQIPSLYQSRRIQNFTAARYALYQALQEIGVKEKDEVLVPAYHCEAMIHPILDAGCLPVFYKIEKDFSTNIADLESLISPRSKAVIAVNYFGFIQNISSVREVCDRHNLQLIEDCAHSMFGHSNNITVGKTGDYAIGSTKKFFPVKEGGILTSNKEFTHSHLSKKSNIKSEIRFIYNSLETALEYNRLWMFKPFIYIIEKLRGQEKQNSLPGIQQVSQSSDNIHDAYSADQRTTQPANLSQFLEKHIPHHRIYVKRRENYAFLVNGLKDIQNIKIPLTEIPVGTVPYMLPVIIDNLDEIFPDIEDAGMPFQRFGQFLWQGAERCTISQEYAKTILQLPCHQGLSQDELLKITHMLSNILETGYCNDH